MYGGCMGRALGMEKREGGGGGFGNPFRRLGWFDLVVGRGMEVVGFGFAVPGTLEGLLET